ncbi:chemoreceptor glutamine deamidase CheD (plasmid) [Paroceanicella profunda]|uniref:Probable chemoreceptor glutamine deamidase CheD n=1 Tax=Paroceanicella profunda TaxID=2579971 RepID=A0A5B8G420_9RHOB|nr:chemoreceptor glutamine deamidase CheD [Paroceanicella profunda]QDL94750.1 chemoreceptor glutamine deamidase CheD [Paroceanicella profunda]
MSTAADRGRPGHFWDPKINAMTQTVLPGFHAVTDEKDLALVTLLGSCVAACIRDPQLGVGGLNHFLLPGDTNGDQKSARYGVHAMEVLINDILKRGGSKGRLEAKVFGGANVIDVSAAETVGDRNSRFVADYLRREGIRITAQDLGGDRARRVFFFPDSGRASVLKLPIADNRRLRNEEMALRSKAQAAPKAGGVELF